MSWKGVSLCSFVGGGRCILKILGLQPHLKVYIGTISEESGGVWHW